MMESLAEAAGEEALMSDRSESGGESRRGSPSIGQRSSGRVQQARASLKQLRDLLRETEAAPAHRLDDQVCGHGVRRTYAWARSAMTAAYERDRDLLVREWHRAVRYHGYHVRLLADLWPDEMIGRLQVLERLGELLSEDRELTILAATLTGGARENGRRRAALLEVIQQRQQALRAMARPLGRRLFAEPASVFGRRLQQCWRSWQLDRQYQGFAGAAGRLAA
jgi:hypothetical protein